MSRDSLLIEFMRYVFPSEIVDYFELVNIDETDGVLNLYLEESNIIPEECVAGSLSPNGFYEESRIKDFPIRDRKVILHIRRRRWIDNVGKSYCRQWELVAEGTRYSREFAFFLKEAFGYLPDSSPIS